MIMMDGDDQKMIKCFTFGKEKKEKNKNQGDQGECIR
jgi:hypothetical protein